MALIFAIIAGVAIVVAGFLLHLLLKERSVSEELAFSLDEKYTEIKKEKTLRMATRRQLGVARMSLGQSRQELRRTYSVLEYVLNAGVDEDAVIERKKARELFLS